MDECIEGRLVVAYRLDLSKLLLLLLLRLVARLGNELARLTPRLGSHLLCLLLQGLQLR